MANTFAVDDTSPAIAYFPFADTITTPNPPPTPNLTAGWNPYIVDFGFATSPGLPASGVTQHITSRNGASLTLFWHGTSIQLFGNTTSQASYSLQLDGTTVQPNTTSVKDNLLALLDGLADTNHTLVLTADIPEPKDPSSLLVFDRAVIESPPPENFSNLTFSEHPLRDNNIAFQGQWTLVASTPPSIHLSTVQGDLAEATFSGISVRILGTTSPSSGNYSVVLDGAQPQFLSAKSSFTNTNVVLFFASGLEANISHHIQLRNEGGGTLQLNSDGFDISSSGEPTALPPSDNGPPSGNPGNTTLPLPPSSPSSGVSTNSGFAKGTIAALVLSGFLAFIFLTGALFYFCVWRPRRRRRQQQHAREIEYGYSPAGATRQRKSRNLRGESQYPREKEQEPIVGNGERGEERVLDIGHEDRNQPDDTINTTPPPVRGTNFGSENGNVVLSDNRSRRASNRSGFARWKRDINTLSGLTTLGLKFRHSDSVGDEKSPGSPEDFVYHPYGDVGIGHGHGGSSGSGNGSGNGFIYGRYDPEVDGGLAGAGGDAVGGMRRHNTRSSSRSLRFGRKRSGNTLTPRNSKDKGKLGRAGSSSFPFRLSPHSRYGDSSGSHPDPYDPYHDLPPRDRDVPKPDGNGDGAEVESLSGLTSLSYASNPNATVYLNAQPPSYAASVSQSNDTSSPPSVPRSVTRSPQSQSRNTSAPPSPLDAQGPGPQHDIPIPAPIPVPTTQISAPRQLRPLPQKPESQPHLPSQSQQPQQSSNRRTRSADDAEVHETGRHILSIGGGLAGVGGPISVRAAIRGLSPRISKSRRNAEGGRGGKGKGKERQSGGGQQLEREQEVQLEREKQKQEKDEKVREKQRPLHGEPSNSPSRSGVGHEQRTTENLPPPPSISTALLPVPRTGSPVRALPPIPIPPAPSSSQAPSKPTPPQKDTSPTSGGKSHRKPPPRDPAVPSEPPSTSFLNIHSASPLKLDFDHLAGTASTSAVASSSSSPTTSSSEKRFKGRSSTGDAAGLGSPGAVQSFAEAAAIAATTGVAGGAGTSTSEVHAGGGSSSSGAPGGERDKGGSRRQSGASRVHFEDDTTSTSASPVTVEALTAKHEKGREGKGKEKEKAQKKDKETQWRFRLTPPSGQSPTSIEIPNSDSENKPEPDRPADMTNTSFLDFNSNPPSLNSRRASEQSGPEHAPSSGGQDRIWSMQLPGRDMVPPIPSSSTGLKSKWSNTTMQTNHTQSSSTDSGNGSEARHLEVVQEVSRRSNIFPFPLAIPPSPNMPEGFTGVEPSPSLMSPTASIPVPGSSKRTAYRKHAQAHNPGPSGTSSGKPEDAAEGGGTESPTDSFPYSISDIHFRNSLIGSDSDHDLEPGQVQFARRRSLTHPPLPSTPLTPQRFNPGQEQPQQPQHSATSSIVQRVFGSRSGSTVARTPPAGQ